LIRDSHACQLIAGSQRHQTQKSRKPPRGRSFCVSSAFVGSSYFALIDDYRFTGYR